MNQNFTLYSKQENKQIISASYFLSSIKNAANFKLSDITLIDLKKFYSICQAKNIQTWMIEQLNLLDLYDNKVIGLIIKTVIEKDLDSSQVVVSFKKYLNFSNVFDKA